MNLDAKELKELILAEIEGAIADGKADVKADYLPTAELLAEEAAAFAAKLARGDGQAAQDLRHIRAQTAILGARMTMRAEEQFMARLETAIIASVRILSKILIAAV